MDLYQCLGVSRNASHCEIDVAFENWHTSFLAVDTCSADADLVQARKVCEAYRILGDREYRLIYDEMLVWLRAPAMTGEISDEEFRSWLRPGDSIREGLNRRRLARQKENKRFWRRATKKLERSTASRRSWIGVGVWALTWASGMAMFLFAWHSFHLILAFAARLHH
jgi:DnaJ-class molecular chaperone